MSYIVKYGDDYLFDPYGDDDERIWDASISANVNASSYFDCTIASTHRLYDKVAERDKIVKVYSDSKLLFMGEISEIEEDFERSKILTCVDPRDHLNDILVRPYSTADGEQPNKAPSSIDGYFQWLIDQYNAGGSNMKFHFYVGVNQGAALSKNNYLYRSSENFPTVGEEIENQILDKLGGYLTLTYPNENPTINLYADVHEANTQIIDFGVNLIDFRKTSGTDEQYTAVRPEGGTPEQTGDTPEDPITIESIGDGVTSFDSDYAKRGDAVFSISGVSRYGYREYSYSNTDILDPKELLEDAVKKLKKKVNPKLTIEVKAVDLALFMDGYDHLECGQVSRIRSRPHKIDEYLLVSSMSLNLNDPAQTVYTFGQAYDSLTGEQSAFVKSLNAGINSSLDAVAGLDQTVKDQGILIDQANNNAITAIEDAQEAQQKADQAQQAADAANDLAQDSLEQAQQAHNLAEQIQAVVNEVTEDVTQIQGDMQQAQEDLEATSQKADQAIQKANELAGSVENVTTEISGLQDDFDGLQVTVSGAVENANEALTQVSQTKTDLEGFKTSVSQTYSTKTELENAITQEVADRNAAIQVGIDGISATVSQNYTELTSKVNDAQADADAALEAAQTASEDLTNFANEVSGDLNDLQSQIDGSIQTWFYAGIPTLANQPANQWTDSTTRNNHLGDLYYDTTTGYAYRFMLQNDTYSWGKITDSDVTKALQDAAKAQDTADNKRRVFVTTPTPPYDVGDLWVQGSGGDIKRCQTAKTSSQSYAEADWVLASKYTDDSALDDYKDVVATTYATKSSLTQTANEIRAEVSESYQVKGDYATSGDLDDAIAQEVLDRNSAISQSASQIQSTVSQTYATKTALNTVDDKADAAQSAANSVQDDLDGFKTTVSETYATKSSVTQTAESIKSEVAATYTTKTEFDALEVGGRNLLMHTAYLNLDGTSVRGSYASLSIDTSNPYNGRASLKIVASSASVSGSKDVWQKCWSNFTVGDNLMLSFWAKGSVSAKMWHRLGGAIVQNGSSSGSESDASSITTAWKHFTVNLGKVTNEGTSGATEIIYGFSVAGTFHVNGMKLEVGTKATDWSPAPEDMASTDYVQTTYATKTALEQTEDSITASVEAKYLSKTDASSTYATKTQLEQTEDSITTTVSQVQTIADNAFAKASQVEQTADGLQVTLTETTATANSALSKANSAATAASNAQSTATALNGRATQTYNFGGASSAAWVRLGTMNTGTSDTVDITVFAGIGYNGNYSQNAKLYITVRDGNHQGQAENRYGVTVVREGNESTEVQVRSSAYGTAEVWIHFTGSYANGSYSISKASDVTWTHSGTVQTSAPTSGTVQSLGYLTNAAAAAKTATNYLKFDSSGLCVGNMTGTLGYNTLIKSTGIDIRNGSTVLASFGPSQITIGQNSSTSQIKMCGNQGTINVTSSVFQIQGAAHARLKGGAGYAYVEGRNVSIDATSGTLSLNAASNITIDSGSTNSNIYLNNWNCDIVVLHGMTVVATNGYGAQNIMSFSALTSKCGFSVGRYNCALFAGTSDYSAYWHVIGSYTSIDSIGILLQTEVAQNVRLNWVIVCWP